MSADGTRDFASTMARLRHTYTIKLAERADELEAAVSRYQDQPGEPSQAAVVDLVHRLAGTAGSFDFHDVSELASAIETRIGQGQSAGALADEIAALVALMRDHARAADAT